MIKASLKVGLLFLSLFLFSGSFLVSMDNVNVFTSTSKSKDNWEHFTWFCEFNDFRNKLEDQKCTMDDFKKIKKLIEKNCEGIKKHFGKISWINFILKVIRDENQELDKEKSTFIPAWEEILNAVSNHLEIVYLPWIARNDLRSAIPLFKQNTKLKKIIVNKMYDYNLDDDDELSGIMDCVGYLEETMGYKVKFKRRKR